MKVQNSAIVVCSVLLTLFGCETNRSAADLENTVGETTEDRGKFWIALKHPMTDGQGEPIPIGQVVDLAGKIPAPMCILMVDPYQSGVNEIPIQSEGVFSSSYGGFLSLLKGVIRDGDVSARAGYQNIREYKVETGDLSAAYIDWAPREGSFTGQFEPRCAKFVSGHREQNTDLYRRLRIVVGTVTADSLNAEIALNPNAIDNGIETEEPAANEVISENLCGFDGSLNFSLSEKIGLSGAAKVCRSGNSQLKFNTPYTVGLRLMTIDEFKMSGLVQDTELKPLTGTVEGRLVSQAEYDALPDDDE